MSSQFLSSESLCFRTKGPGISEAVSLNVRKLVEGNPTDLHILAIHREGLR